MNRLVFILSLLLCVSASAQSPIQCLSRPTYATLYCTDHTEYHLENLDDNDTLVVLRPEGERLWLMLDCGGSNFFEPIASNTDTIFVERGDHCTLWLVYIPEDDAFLVQERGIGTVKSTLHTEADIAHRLKGLLATEGEVLFVENRVAFTRLSQHKAIIVKIFFNT